MAIGMKRITKKAAGRAKHQVNPGFKGANKRSVPVLPRGAKPKPISSSAKRDAGGPHMANSLMSDRRMK